MHATIDGNAIDEALAGHGMRDYYRGLADARRYAAVRRLGSDWLAEPIDGAEPIIVEPVGDDYLDGLRAGGCSIEPRSLQSAGSSIAGT